MGKEKNQTKAYTMRIPISFMKLTTSNKKRLVWRSIREVSERIKEIKCM